MPRGPRLDAPGVLHHIMVRGLDRQTIFRGDRDREDFLRRVATLVEAGGLTVYAWALLPNHVHMLVRSGRRPLARTMRSLLTGYAGAFNRRHGRSGHLFQNRYKSIVIEEEPYLLELVRYIHLNPLRAGVVGDRGALDRYRWTGHSALMGRVARPWQALDQILAHFAAEEGAARRRYGAFVTAGQSRGRRPEFQGGGLVRSAGGWAVVAHLRRGREAYTADERVLGGSDFVATLHHDLERQGREQIRLRRKAPDLPTLLERAAIAAGILPEALLGGARSRTVARVRDTLAYLWIEVLGRSGRELAQTFAMHPVSVCRAARRARLCGVEWEHLLA